VARLGLVALLALPIGCGGEGADGRTVGVVAPFYPVAEAVRRVGGERVRVTDLTPPGAEAHDLELTTGQRDRIEDADVVFVLGRGFQPAVEAAARRRDGPTVVILDRLRVVRGAPGELRTDPHVWLDPVAYREVVDVVAAALAAADPAGAAGYRRRAARFGAEIEAVHDRYRSGTRECERRLLVTAHEAFGWLAARYGLRQEGIAGIEPGQEPSPDRLAELARLVERTGTTTIFTEERASPRLARALARDAGVRTEVLDTLETLSPQRARRGEGYVSVMDRNLTRIRDALGCGAPGRR
jgi:zinc transport system substrate-binding protein